MIDVTNKKIGIWGYGREGQSVLRHLIKIGGAASIEILLDEIADNMPDTLPVITGKTALDKISSGAYDIIFKSPGISLYRDEVIAAKENGTTISSATNLWFAANPQTQKIVVTGTKGKSTTSSLLYHIMKQAEKDVTFAGNIGKPLLDIETPAAITIIEMSSYQLADLVIAPDIFVVLNLFPEHLPWHMTHDNYYNDKLRPIELSPAPVVIANFQDEKLAAYMKAKNKKPLWFNNDEGFHVTGDNIYQGTQKLNIRTALKGTHNKHNICAALTVAAQIDVDLATSLKAIETFEPIPHRLQEFVSSHGLTCVNDSISTTPETTIAALNVYKNRPLFLILGGTDRGQDYSALIQSLNNYPIKAIALLPKNGARLYDEMKNAGRTANQTATLAEACLLAKQNADPDTVILLSPGAPSYDQFKNFEERGLEFIKLMNQ